MATRRRGGGTRAPLWTLFGLALLAIPGFVLAGNLMNASGIDIQFCPFCGQNLVVGRLGLSP